MIFSWFKSLVKEHSHVKYSLVFPIVPTGQAWQEPSVPLPTVAWIPRNPKFHNRSALIENKKVIRDLFKTLFTLGSLNSNSSDS